VSDFAIGLASFPILLVLLAVRVPVGVAMIFVGGCGIILMNGWTPLISQLKTGPYFQFSSYSLSVIPFFLLMGQFAAKAGMSRALFQAANVWLGHRRGGIAMAAIGGCAGFGAICGSSLATAATMGQVALPEMKRFNYSGALATGALAAGGTLGILIPPSVILVIYAILTEQNIAKKCSWPPSSRASWRRWATFWRSRSSCGSVRKPVPRGRRRAGPSAGPTCWRPGRSRRSSSW
jgi:TRAP-type mannitol/chloroaromatic compound transport system permease large subunit